MTLEDSKNLKSFSNATYVSSLSSTLLTNLNSTIATIDDPESKERVQYIVSELSKQILVRLILKSPSSPKEILDQIHDGLKVSCQMNEWNFDDLKRRLNFDILHTVVAKTTTKNQSLHSPIRYYYEWKGESLDLIELAYNLKDKKTIKSTTEFLRLFEKEKKELQIRIAPDCLDFMIVLIDELKALSLIEPKGLKAKHFTPLKTYAVDLEKNVLITKEPKTIKYRIKKNLDKYSALKANVEKLLSGYSPDGLLLVDLEEGSKN